MRQLLAGFPPCTQSEAEIPFKAKSAALVTCESRCVRMRDRSKAGARESISRIHLDLLEAQSATNNGVNARWLSCHE